MYTNKFYKTLPFGVVLILLLAFSNIVIAQRVFQSSTSRIIPVQKIYEDIVGKGVDDIPSEITGSNTIGWIFEENEPREVEILDNQFVDDAAYITIKMFTQGYISRDGVMGRLRGNLRLHYERIAGGWLLNYVENLSFKYAPYNPSNRTTIRSENPAPLPSVQSLVSGAFTISAGYSKSFRFVVPNRANVSRRFRVSEARYDIEVLILDQDGYDNFTSGHSTSTFFNSGRRTVGTINTNLGAGVYYVVFNNGYSFLTPKAVEATVTIQYQ